LKIREKFAITGNEFVSTAVAAAEEDRACIAGAAYLSIGRKEVLMLPG
jgi:hypothetical protein